MGSDPVMFLGHCQRGDAKIGQRRPHLASRRGIAVGPGSYRRRQVGGTQRRVDAGREIALLFVDFEVHLLSLGRPSNRSAMMLR